MSIVYHSFLTYCQAVSTSSTPPTNIKQPNNDSSTLVFMFRCMSHKLPLFLNAIAQRRLYSSIWAHGCNACRYIDICSTKCSTEPLRLQSTSHHRKLSYTDYRIVGAITLLIMLGVVYRSSDLIIESVWPAHGDIRFYKRA